MTNKEAIKNLKKLKSYHNGSYGTAIDMAIKALVQQQNVHDTCKKCVEFSEFEQQPCEDVIRREDVINLVHDLAQPCDDRYDWDISADEMIDGIKDLPSVTPSIREWLESFNTDSATACFTAVQQLKEKIYAKNSK